MDKIIPTHITDEDVVILVDFLPRGETVNAEAYTETFKIQREKKIRRLRKIIY